MGRVFANGPGDLGSIPSGVIPKTFKMVLDTSLLNTQQYIVRIKGKVEQSRERSSTLSVVAIEKGAFWTPSTMVANFTFYLLVLNFLLFYLTHWYSKNPFSDVIVRVLRYIDIYIQTNIYIYIYIYIYILCKVVFQPVQIVGNS